MKKLVIAALLIGCSAHALACPVSQTLAKRYGISFSGFKTAIPVATAPDTSDAGSFIRILVRDESKVSDGFHHTIVMNAETNKAWILRTGGFPGVYKWFGPVDVSGSSLEHCRLEEMSAVVLAAQNR